MADTTATSPASNYLEKAQIYVRTRKGMILASEALLSLIVIICYASSYSGGYSIMALCEMIFAIVFFVIFMMDLDKRFITINWLWSDLFRAGLGAILYLITSLVCVIQGSWDGARVAGGVIGLIAALLFAYDTYILYLEVRSSQPHTGEADGRV